MRLKAFGLMAAMVIASLIPATVIAASKKAPDVPAAARKQGMAEAPGVVEAMGLGCKVTDARFVGKSVDPKTKAASSFYEVDCEQGIGLILQAAKDQPTSTFTCIEANTIPPGAKTAPLPCILPGNLDPKADLAPYFQKAKTQCTPADARGIGQTKTNTLLEVACQEGPGYILVAGAPMDLSKDVEAQNCLAYDDTQGNVKCILRDKASRLAVLDQYVTAAKNGCVIKERRFVGTTKDGSNYFETSCEDGKGYIYHVNPAGQLAMNIDCAKAQSLLGGCTLTDARQAATEQAGLYTRLAGSAGSTCQVETYAVFPAKGDTEVVELLCKDGKGAIGMFPGSGKGQVVDCGHAPLAGYRCSLSKDKGYESLTADLRKMEKKECTVSNSGAVGKMTNGNLALEVACSDGLPGWVIEYNPSLTPVNVTGCKFTTCKLPGNG